MENTVVEIAKESMWNTFTYSPLLDSLAAVAAVLIPLCFRSIRDYIINKCKTFISKRKEYHAPGKDDLSRFYNIDNTLAVLRDNTHADRVSIYQFHNGEEFSVHNPIFKFTCSHVFLELGVSPDSNAVKRLLVSNYMDFIGPLVSDEFMRPGITRIKTDKSAPITTRIIKYDLENMHFSATRYLFDSLGVDVLYAIPLKSRKGNVIGLVCFQYLTYASDVFDSVDKTDLCSKVMRIQHIINGENI